MPNVGPEDPCGVIRKNPREEVLKTTSYHKKYHTVGTFHTPAWYLAFFFSGCGDFNEMSPINLRHLNT